MFVIAVAVLGAAIFTGVLLLDRALDREKKERVGYLGQWAAGCIVGSALGYEIAAKAEVGYAVMTLGSIMFAAFTKLRRK